MIPLCRTPLPLDFFGTSIAYLLIESCPSSRDQKCTLLWMQLEAILEHMWIGHYLSSSSSLLLSEHLQTNSSSSKATTIDSTLCHGGKNNGIKWFQDEDVHFSCHSQKNETAKTADSMCCVMQKGLKLVFGNLRSQKNIAEIPHWIMAYIKNKIRKSS